MNTLYVRTLNHNLITPFILNEADITCNDRPKRHCNESSDEDHCINNKNSGLTILLKSNEIFSFFHSRTPIHLETENEDKDLKHLIMKIGT